MASISSTAIHMIKTIKKILRNSKRQCKLAVSLKILDWRWNSVWLILSIISTTWAARKHKRSKSKTCSKIFTIQCTFHWFKKSTRNCFLIWIVFPCYLHPMSDSKIVRFFPFRFNRLIFSLFIIFVIWLLTIWININFGCFNFKNKFYQTIE